LKGSDFYVNPALKRFTSLRAKRQHSKHSALHAAVML